MKTDSEGRFCLNDLHKAAGGNDRDKPVYFFKLDSTEALAIELLKGKDSYLYAPIKPVATKTAPLLRHFHTSYTTHRRQMRLKPAWLRGFVGGFYFLLISILLSSQKYRLQKDA